MSTRTVPIPFLTGVDQSHAINDQEEIGRLRSVRNLRVAPTRLGTLSLRPGIIAQQGGQQTTPYRALSTSDTVVATTDADVMRFVPNTSIASLGRPASLMLKRETVEFSTYQFTVHMVGTAESFDQTCSATVTMGTNENTTLYELWATPVNNGVKSSPVRVTTSATPITCSVFSIGTTNETYVCFVAGGNLVKVGITGISAGVQSTIVAGVTLHFDALNSVDGRVYLAYKTAGNQIGLSLISTAGAVTSVTRAVNPTIVGLGVDANNTVAGELQTVHVWWIETGSTTTLRLATYAQSNLGASTAATPLVAPAVLGLSPYPTMLSSGANRSGTACESLCIISSLPGGTQAFYGVKVAGVVTITNLSGANFMPTPPRSRVWSRPNIAGEFFFSVGQRYQGIVYRVRQSPFQVTIAGTFGYGTAYHGSLPAGSWLGCANQSIVDRPSGDFTALAFQAILGGGSISSSADTYTGRAQFSGTTGWNDRAARWRDYYVLTGGALRYFEGPRIIPNGFLQTPAVNSLTPSGAGGSITGGVYLYAVVWEYVDLNGVRHQSPAYQFTTTVPAGSTGSVSFTVVFLPIDERVPATNATATATLVSLVVYRTDPGGSILRRNTRSNATYPLSFYQNSVAFTDTSGTSVYASGEVLDEGANGSGQLPNFAPPGFYQAFQFQDRMLGLYRGTPSLLWYSKSRVDGRGLAFNPALAIDLGADLVGMAQMDGNVIAFTDDDVLVLTPSFADNAGKGIVNQDAQRYGTGVGCQDTRSIVETPVGVFFQGRRGIYLMPRGGAPPQFIGDRIEASVGAGVTVHAAVYRAETSDVCFLVESTSTFLAVFNTQTTQWSLWYYFELQSGGQEFATRAFTVDPTGILVFGEQFANAPLDYRLAFENAVGYDQQSTGSFFNQTIASEVETADMDAGDWGGQCRVRNVILIGELPGTGQVATIEVAESTDSGRTYPFSEQFALNTAGEIRLTYQVQNQRAAHHRFRIRSIPTSGGGTTGFPSFNGLAVELAPIAKSNRLPASFVKG